MLRDIVAKREARDVAWWYGARADDTKRLLEKHAPVLCFEEKENFFPMSALLYLVCSTIWHIPVKPREDWGEPRFFDLLRTSPHIQLELDTDLEPLDPETDPTVQECVDLVDVEKRFANSPDKYPYAWARKVVKRKLKRLQVTNAKATADAKTEGILALHFADTIGGWWLWRPHLWLPKDTGQKAKEKYDILTREGKDVCYYGRVVDQCGYRILQYWFFYAFNDWMSDLPRLNKHEGDWECVFIYGKPEGEDGFTPTHTAYSSHTSSGTKVQRRWDDVETYKKNHPVVYVGRGSHANYYTPGRHHWLWLDSAEGNGRKIEPGDWGEIRLLVDDEPWDQPEWLFFRGFWGAHIRDISTMQNAPLGPHYSAEPVTSRPRRRTKWWTPRQWAGLPCLLGSKCVDEFWGTKHPVRGWTGSVDNRYELEDC